MPYKDPEIAKEYIRKWRIANPIAMKKYAVKYYQSHKDERAEYQSKLISENPKRRQEIRHKSYLKNREKELASTKAYRLSHPEIQRKSTKDYRRRNLAKNAAQVNAREALKIMAMPKWVNRESVVAIYIEARRITLTTGIAHHVDHIWPLRGEGFIGLHVPWNLRIIPAIENIRKGNKRPIS